MSKQLVLYLCHRRDAKDGAEKALFDATFLESQVYLMDRGFGVMNPNYLCGNNIKNLRERLAWMLTDADMIYVSPDYQSCPQSRIEMAVAAHYQIPLMYAQHVPSLTLEILKLLNYKQSDKWAKMGVCYFAHPDCYPDHYIIMQDDGIFQARFTEDHFEKLFRPRDIFFLYHLYYEKEHPEIIKNSTSTSTPAKC